MRADSGNLNRDGITKCAQLYSWAHFVIIVNMVSIITKVFITALALVITAYIIPGMRIESMQAALLGALILGLLNVLVKPVLIALTLPITIVTLGLFLFVINAALLILAASPVEGFVIDSFLWALLASVSVSVVSALLNRFIN